MNYNFGLHQKATQGLSLTPKLIQIFKLIRCSTTELIEYIQHEIAENPFLSEDLQNTNTVNIDEIKSNKLDDSIEDGNYQIESYQTKDRNTLNKLDGLDKSAIIEETITNTEHLSEVLLEQLRFYYLESEKKYKIGEYIIGSLDDNGYLKKEIIPQLIKELKVSEQQFEQVLSIIKTFEPVGVASGDLQECILTQIRNINEDGDHELEYNIVKDHLPMLGKKKYLDILAKILNISSKEVRLAAQHISLLEPKPGRKYQPINNIEIIPDIKVENIDGQLKLSLNNGYLPIIKFNKQYNDLLKIKKNYELFKYLNEKKEKAELLLESIEYRQSGLLKVMEKIIVVQKDFFYHGIKAMKPYTSLKLAESTNIHPGTISRIVNSKYIETEWGVFNLRIFLSSSIPSTNGNVSSSKIKELIKEIIASYDSEKKLSDQKIAETLYKKGYTISRRTVTKYREKLSIPSSLYR